MGKDYVKVISPVEEDYSFCFWEKCRTGRLPTAGDCKGPEYDCSFTFDIGYAWQLRAKIQEYAGIPQSFWHGPSRYTLFNTFQESFLKAIPVVFSKHGFKAGQLTAIGYARRPSKGKWDFTFTGANVKIDENFILAKLMDREMFETEIWQEAIKLTAAEFEYAV